MGGCQKPDLQIKTRFLLTRRLRRNEGKVGGFRDIALILKVAQECFDWGSFDYAQDFRDDRMVARCKDGTVKTLQEYFKALVLNRQTLWMSLVMNQWKEVCPRSLYALENYMPKRNSETS